jgi:hypothetical protein
VPAIAFSCFTDAPMLSSEGLSRRTVNPLTAPAFPSRTSLGPANFLAQGCCWRSDAALPLPLSEHRLRSSGFVAKEVSDDQTYVSVTCIMCRQIHLVNPSKQLDVIAAAAQLWRNGKFVARRVGRASVVW